ncbi:hypothetical protein QBC38DRAFT_376165 [Podospora fimiseda]|uniref:Ecp2 effector protein domain-containing protein n=1 Tax=Podospora fimiseda TaxID=252190 RepID=A0AAN6YMF4_9PEZI|nr:hypothetical protein QBC38DRAFT_376165 [Podospora fimiseda]
MSPLLKTALLTLILSLTSASSSLLPRQSCGKGTQKICYGQPTGTPQNIEPSDLEYLAAVIRYDARKNGPQNPGWFNMPPNPNFQCEEWTIASEGTVMILVKHTSARLNTTVLAEDIAKTLDDAEGGILGCGENGGQRGVIYDKGDQRYNDERYKSWKSTPEGLVIKVVRAG